MTEKEIKSLYYLSTFAWTFPATSAKQFLAFAFLDTTLFLVQRMRHDRNIRPYELRICDRCDWHTIQDEEHILLDCPHEHLVTDCLADFAHSNSLSSHLSLRMAQLV